MNSIWVRIALVIALLIVQVPAMVSLARLPQDNSRMQYRVAVLVFMLVTTAAAVALAASVAVSVVDP
jgi:hypothetical protein